MDASLVANTKRLLPSWVTRIFAAPGEGRLARWSRLLSSIDTQERAYKDLFDAKLRKASLELRYRAKSGEALDRLMPAAFALVRLAAERAVGMRPFDVQIIGGAAMFGGAIAEMQTGEGKTLTATLPLYLRALPGRGSHIATVNDYLARRDGQWMEPVFHALGFSVGIIQTEMSPAERRAAYACDVTYGTAKEFGFDFLRDRLLKRRQQQFAGAAQASQEQPVQRGAYFVLVDEADSVLIDDARTPLVISALPGPAEAQKVSCFQWATQAASQFQESTHYRFDHDKKTVELNFNGRALVRSLAHPPELDSVGYVDLYEYVERAIKVQREFHCDQHFVIREGEIVIVDEATGRIAEGRKWSQGIHQAVEAKEGVEVTVDSGQAARITVQDFFLRYQHLAGMTGTAVTSRWEFRKIYRRRVVQVPTNRPVRRQRLPDAIFPDATEKWQAIAAEVRELHVVGRPVLIGTRTIAKSEHLSKLLSEAGIPHQVLNAHRIAEEAEIVSRAGQAGQVTVATNMAGRGTDIKLDEEAHLLGGLHVICTELHDSARIDRQLFGRCGRQGDPGTYRVYLALDDEVLAIGLRPAQATRVRAAGQQNPNRSLFSYRKIFLSAQRRIERRHYRQRRLLLHHEKQVKKLHREMGQDPYLESPS